MIDDLEEFKTEILETLESAEKALLEFEAMEDNASSGPLYDEVFRAYHNIKGAAGMLEWKELMNHVHQLENILMQSKNSSSIPKKYIGWFLKGNDVTRSILANEPYEFSYDIEGSSPETHGASDEIPAEFYAEVDESSDKVSSILMKFENGETDREYIDELYRQIHSIKGAVQLFGLENASALVHVMEASLEPLRQLEKVEMDRALSSTLLLSLDLLNQCIQQPKNEQVAKEVDFMKGLLEPFCVEAVKPVEKTKAPEVISVKNSHPAPESKSDTEKQDTTIRVQVSLLDNLMTLMGEMVLVRNQVLQYSNKCDDLEFLNLSQKLDVVTSELQEETMKTRMQPIGNVLSKFQRVVRDLSATLGKKINLNLVGVETELDKTLIEAIKDPLTHIVRNSCDHGIESPDMRRASGKSETGTLTIEAYHEGGQVIISISDDGKGLNRERLLNKALEKGIVTQEKIKTLTDQDIQNLIFAPGFSTAEKVTNVSGRGVGMDVVKSNIEKIGGVVDISSVEGKGTEITLKIPLTLAIVPALIIRSSEERYTIPQVKLVELVRVTPKQIEYVQGRPIYRLRGSILPLVDLKEVFGLDSINYKDSSEEINIVVLHSQSKLFGLIVDEILDTADIVVKPIASFLKPLSIYSGATVLGDGHIAFILDVLGIAQKYLNNGPVIESKVSVNDKYFDYERDQYELHEFVLVRLGAEAKHAIPLSCVSRMEEFHSSSFEYSGHQRVVRYRDSILKIISLNQMLNYPVNAEKETVQIIVVNLNDQFFGVEVDQILDVLSTRSLLDESVCSHACIKGNLVTESEIIVVLDVERVIEEATERKASFSSQSGQRRILLVEDTYSIRENVTNMLQNEGYEVTAAADGIEALKKLVDFKFQFDLIISDIEMPRMNGYEFMKKVRSIDRMKKVPSIAFTANNSDKDLVQAKESGFNTFLEKGKVKLLKLLINECLIPKRKSA